MTTSEDAEELVGLLVDDGVCGGGVVERGEKGGWVGKEWWGNDGVGRGKR